MDAGYGARYADLYARHWWWRAREALVLRTIAGLAPAAGFGAILDVGCGDGLLLPRLVPFGEPLGLEADGALVTAAGRARGRIQVAPFDRRFQPGRRFGLITMLDVLEHLDEPVAALAHAAALLRPGGVVLLTVPAFRLLWTGHDEVNHHRTRYTRASLGREARAAGLLVRRQRYFFHWLVAPKLLVKLRERLAAGVPRPAAVPPPHINRAAELLSRLEQASWGRLPLPFGSSLLAILAPAAGDGSDTDVEVREQGA